MNSNMQILKRCEIRHFSQTGPMEKGEREREREKERAVKGTWDSGLLINKLFISKHYL